MAVSLLIKTYSSSVAKRVSGLIAQHQEDSWLHERHEQVYQICDELIKNAVKSNYKFLLLWLATRKRVMDEFPDFSIDDADEWLKEIFFCGENVIIQKQLDKIPNWERIQVSVRKILDLENELLKHKRGDKEQETESLFSEFSPLLKIKRLARQLDISIHFRIERSVDQVLVTVTNDAPILEEDVNRIDQVRAKFRAYYDRGEPHAFFIENMDTSGGGHGLGYALMDSMLLDMGLQPDHSLYLVSAGRTMVLLALPLKQPE